jgi:hypothetical protein
MGTGATLAPSAEPLRSTCYHRGCCYQAVTTAVVITVKERPFRARQASSRDSGFSPGGSKASRAASLRLAATLSRSSDTSATGPSSWLRPGQPWSGSPCDGKLSAATGESALQCLLRKGRAQPLRPSTSLPCFPPATPEEFAFASDRQSRAERDREKYQMPW